MSQGGPFPPEILERIYADLQYRADALKFRSVCRLWNEVATSEGGKCRRWCQQRLTCTFLDTKVTGCSTCCRIGEFQCEVCEEPEDLCSQDARVRCSKCQRRLGPRCCVSRAPVCVECVQKCELGCDKKSQRFIGTPWDFEGIIGMDDKFYYCTECQLFACYRCLFDKRDCFRQHHQYYYLSDMFATKIVNMHR